MYLASETTRSSTKVLHPNSFESIATCKITCFCLLPLKPLLAFVVYEKPPFTTLAFFWQGYE